MKTKVKTKEFEILIEMPKGDDRRRHLKHTKDSMIDLGPIKGRIPVNNGIMPIAYGLVMNTANPEEDRKVPEEIDALVYSNENFKVGQRIMAIPLAILVREDGDHKIVFTDRTTAEIKKWEDIPNAERKLIMEYFGYNSPIKSKVEDSKHASQLIAKSKTKIEYHIE